MVAAYDAKNPPALARLVQQGVKLQPFPKDVMIAAIKAAHDIYDEEAAANPVFRRFYQSWKAFRSGLACNIRKGPFCHRNLQGRSRSHANTQH